MLNTQKIFHIVFGIIITISYSCFIIQLTDPSPAGLVFLIIFCLLLLLYIIKTYAIFHFPPTQPNFLTTEYEGSLIFSFKLTQERRRQLQFLMRQGKVKDRQSLQTQYVQQHLKPSFCDICQRVQPPRTYHCLICDTCIVSKQKHSGVIGFCIGENNQKAYMIYLLISEIIIWYMLITLLITQISNFQNYQKLHSFLKLYYFILTGSKLLLFLFFFKEFNKFFNQINLNQTICESNDPYLKNKQLFKAQNQTQSSSMQFVKLLFDFNSIGEAPSLVSSLEEYNCRQ